MLPHKVFGSTHSALYNLYVLISHFRRIRPEQLPCKKEVLESFAKSTEKWLQVLA